MEYIRQGAITEEELANLEAMIGEQYLPWRAEGNGVSDLKLNLIAAFAEVYPECAIEIEDANAKLIVAAVNSLPRLIAEIRRLREAPIGD